jgi:hypothetical protein
MYASAPSYPMLTGKGDHDTYITYSTILELHLAHTLQRPYKEQNAVLTTLEEVLNDPNNVRSL